MAVQKQDDQHEHTFSSYVRIRDVVLKTCLGRRTIGRSDERGSGIAVLPARHDDDDDDDEEEKITEWEITKREVEIEMEIFITLTKYNTRQQRVEVKPLLLMYNWISILNPLQNSVQRIYEEWDIHINVRRYSI